MLRSAKRNDWQLSPAATARGVRIEAIFDAESVPEEWAEYIEINKKLAAVWPSISEATDPLETADSWKKVEAKEQYLHLDETAAAALEKAPYGPPPKAPPGDAAADASSPPADGPADEAAPAASPPPAAVPEPEPEAASAPPGPAQAAPALAESPTIRVEEPHVPSDPGPTESTAPPPRVEGAGMARKVARKVLPRRLRSSLKKALGRS